MKNHILTTVAMVLVATTSFSQSQRELYNQSTEAYKVKNYVQFLKITQKLDSLRPLHPTYTYNLAAAYSLNHDEEKAVTVLNRLVLMNNTLSFEIDTDFDNLKQSQGYQKVIQLKSDMAKTVANSEKMISLSEKDLHPESVVYLPKHKIWLASSIRKKKIVSFDMKTGQCSDWFTESNFSVFAMKADKDEKYLWVATGAMPEMLGFSKEMEGKSEVLKIDLKTHKILNRLPMEGNHVFGDLTIDQDGTVYVSDSGSPIIYKISNDKMSAWIDLKDEAFNLQGIALNEDHSKLFIADYLKGILVIDAENPDKRSWLSFPVSVSPKGIDGLVYYKQSLFAIQNGVKPIRVMQLVLNKEQNLIEEFKIIDNNRPEFDEPALATVVNNKLYFFSNSPWKAYTKNFELDATKFEAPMLYQYDIKK